MAVWRVEFTPIGERDLGKLDRRVRRQIVERVEWLTENFDVLVPIPLHAAFKNYFKLRVGDRRVAYTFEPFTRIIKIRFIDHRTKIYKRLR